jgi:cell division protein FtsB
VKLLAKLPTINLTRILVVSLMAIQFPLWFGEGGWIRVWLLERELDQKAKLIEDKRQQILSLAAEANDLKSGPKAAEERARFELGLIMPGERFVQWVQPSAASLGQAPQNLPSP